MKNSSRKGIGYKNYTDSIPTSTQYDWKNRRKRELQQQLEALGKLFKEF
jgi:hypothetical protein